jgi:hypothetical protein
MTFQRPHFQKVRDRLNEPRRFIQVIFGPRQVGKTTLIQQVLASLGKPFHFSSADQVSNGHVWIEQQWEVARTRIGREQLPEIVLALDEIQKIPNWSEAVKRLWDQDTQEARAIKVVLLGSSRLLLQQGLTESLAGRFETIYTGHWTLDEMHKAFGMSEEEYVWFGGYPGAASLIRQEDRWRRYITDSLIESSISRDILLLTRVDKPALMRRLFELGSASSGQIVSYSKITGQLQDAGNTVTLAHYMSLLDTAGLLAGLEKFAGNAIRQRASSPKFQVHNTALLSAQQGMSFQEVRSDPALWGRWIESAIGAHLLNESLAHGLKLYYWRERSDEVDFVVQSGQKVIAIEVKSGASKQTKGMAAFVKAWTPFRSLLIARDAIPWQEFLKMNVRDLFL